MFQCIFITKKKKGVTLLEIMLVLAIAAIIIVMSVRYYQSATAAQQANAVVQQLNAIVATANSLTEATLTYSKLTTSQVALILPKNTFVTPWGTPITLSFLAQDGFTMNLPKIPKLVCPLVITALSVNKNFTGIARAKLNATTIKLLCPNALNDALGISYNRNIK